MTDKPSTLYIAKTANFPGYWGSDPDSILKAIASCREEGADSGDLFVVYQAYKGCRITEMGAIQYLIDHGEPEVEGVYDAAGNRFGDNLADAAQIAREGYSWQPIDSAVGVKQFEQLKSHKG